jgi:hypothetical protein
VTRRIRGDVHESMRLSSLLPLALVVVACGSTKVSHPQLGPAPKTGPKGPPAAWIETKAGRRWLGFSSYCWGNVCADAAAPRCSQQSVPSLTVDQGETVRAHLGYAPDEASVEDAHAKLDGRTVTWRVERPGPFLLFTRGSGQDASYVGCGALP